jgi:hypothetical protein
MRLDTAPRRCRVFGAVSCEIVAIMVPPDNYLPGNGARRGRGAALDATGHQGRCVESAELLVVEEFRDGGWQRSVLMCNTHEHVWLSPPKWGHPYVADPVIRYLRSLAPLSSGRFLSAGA